MVFSKFKLCSFVKSECQIVPVIQNKVLVDFELIKNLRDALQVRPDEHIWLPSSGPSSSRDTECYVGEQVFRRINARV